MATQQRPSSTQQFLSISGIEQDLVVLNNGGVRKVVRAYPINFDLKSEQEQNAIIYSYQTFLNSLSFPIEIVIRSKKLDLERYLIKLESQTKNITNNLLQIQAQDYIGFVRRLIQIANIMSKHFYIIVGYDNPIKSRGVFSSILPGKNQVHLGVEQIKTLKQEIENRAATVMAGLSSVGIRTEILTTQKLIELFYNIYNPEESMTERLAPVEELEADIILTGKEKGLPNSSSPENLVPAPAPNIQDIGN